MAVARVQERVRLGGHNIPEETIRRRYQAGPRHFFRLYQALTASWSFLDNSHPDGPRELASGQGTVENHLGDAQQWQAIKARWSS
jgi:predicted ABC-type ATPase